MLKFNVSERIQKPIHKIMELPTLIRVTDIDEDAVGVFHEGMTAALAGEQPVIPVLIDSFGGEVYSLMAMLDIIEAAKQSALVATVVTGKAMSAGAVLLAAGSPEYRYIGANATIMVHQAMAHVRGKVSDMENDVAEIKRGNTRALKTLDKYTGQATGYFAKTLRARGNTDWFMSPREAITQGLADQIGTPTYMVHVDVKYSFG
jgi:ATP-dependent Clp endopeptidase proteolytic subunit ClpP